MMKKVSVGFLVALSCSALLVGGCAKKELVKEEAPVPAVTQPSEAPTPAQLEVKEEAVSEPEVKEAPAVAEETASSQPMVSLGNIYFDFDSYVLTAPSRDTLTGNAELLKKEGSVSVQIAGNCDERGSDEYNMALGEKRAKAAMDYLVTLGIPSSRLSIISYGEEKPVDQGHDEAAWAKNRRDEFTIIIK